VLVEAVEKLGEPYRLLMIGAGAAAPASSQLITIDYQREQGDVARLLASCDAFVHANDVEPFGLVVLEAMACGLPVVGVASGGVAESVDEGVGQLAVRSTPEAMAEAIAALFERDVAEVGRAARQRAVDRHGWERVFGELSGVYGVLTGQKAFMQTAAVAAH
ncbi:MAG: glycosyl transferase, partial [Caulobacter sp.]|nr:glycosyl transferase [Caulobacter sp.]